MPLPLRRLPPKFNTPITFIWIHSAILSQYHTHLHTTIHQTSHWQPCNVPNSPPKLSLPLWQSPPKSNTWIQSLTPTKIPNCVPIHSAVLPGCRMRSSRQTNRPQCIVVLQKRWEKACRPLQCLSVCCRALRHVVQRCGTLQNACGPLRCLAVHWSALVDMLQKVCRPLWSFTVHVECITYSATIIAVYYGNVTESLQTMGTLATIMVHCGRPWCIVENICHVCWGVNQCQVGTLHIYVHCGMPCCRNGHFVCVKCFLLNTHWILNLTMSTESQWKVRKNCQLFTHESNTFLDEQYVILPIETNRDAIAE